MNPRVIELREVVTKLVPLLAGKGLRVTQIGSNAYVRTNLRTRKPELVNIPMIPDNAQDDFIQAIQGFIDHEIGHVLITDWNYYAGAPTPEEMADPKVRAFANTHNIVEDTMIEREIVRIFPGAARNIAQLREHFIAKVTKPTLAKCTSDKERFVYLLVPLMRALAGHPEFKELMDEGHWENEYVKALTDKLDNAYLKRLNTCSTTKETLELARELHAILYPPPPPAPPVPPPPSKDEECDSDAESKGQSEDKPEKKADEGDGDGERDHQPKEDEEEGAEPDAEGEASEGDKDADEEEEGADDADDGEDDTSGDADDADGDSQADEGDEDGDDDGAAAAAAAAAAGDDDEDGDSDGSDEEDETSGSAGLSVDEDGDEDAESEAAGAESGGLAENKAPEDLSFDNEEATGSGGGVGTEAAKSIFDFAENAFDEADMSAAVSKIISKEIEGFLGDRSTYLPFTRELDTIKPLEVPEKMNEEWVPKMDEEVRSMTGQMQKDIERMMASQSHILHTPGHRRGKLHAPSLYRVMQGDPRVFRQKEEHVSKDTAVTLLIDNSGSMSGAKMRLAMISGYALSATLDRVKITHEVLGFTTGSMGTVPSLVQQAMEEEYRKGAVWRVYDRTEPIMMPIYKDFDERLSPIVKKRIAYAMNAQRGLNGNIDGESVEYAAMRLMKRTEKRKVMLVLSDGQPAGGPLCQPHLRTVIKDCQEKFGIDMIGIGIMDTSVSRFYPKHVVLRNANDLPGQVMSEIKKLLA